MTQYIEESTEKEPTHLIQDLGQIKLEWTYLFDCVAAGILLRFCLNSALI